MSFYSDYVRHNNNRCVEENSHSKQELLTELDKISESQLRTTESLAYKIDRYMYSRKNSGLLVGFLFGLVIWCLLFFTLLLCLQLNSINPSSRVLCHELFNTLITRLEEELLTLCKHVSKRCNITKLIFRDAA